jgi:hypothetical protein
MTTVQRFEWRGDAFASELPHVLQRLEGARVISHELPHTLTIFLQQEDAAFGLDRTLRIRAYCALKDLSSESVRRALVDDGLRSKLQLKATGGATTELANGRIVTLYAGAEDTHDASMELQLGPERYVPASVRVAERVHYELPSTIGAQPFRVTVDTARHLYRMTAGTLHELGAMGPRVEIKATDERDVAAALRVLNHDAVLVPLRYRSLELLFGDMLRDAVAASALAGSPEIEAKFDLAGCDAASATAAALGWIRRSARMRLLLPFPHRIVRMRRYHLCAGDDDGQHSVVETTAGRLSAKSKRDAVVRGTALVRSTVASRTTDLDGAIEPVETFIARRGWRLRGTMTKTQTKIPFGLPNGNAYLVSIDDCTDANGGELRQVELEYIGGRGAPLLAEIVCAELDELAASLRREPVGDCLHPTTVSKHEFFARRAVS